MTEEHPISGKPKSEHCHKVWIEESPFLWANEVLMIYCEWRDEKYGHLGKKYVSNCPGCGWNIEEEIWEAEDDD